MVLLCYFLELVDFMDWFIYVYGDVRSTADAMQFLSIVDQDGSYQNMLYLATVFGIFSAMFIKKAFDYKAAGIQIGSVVLLMGLIFGARVDVNIVNVKTYQNLQTESNYARVSNVPFVFAFTASVFSTIGYETAKLVHNGIGIVADQKYNEISFLKTGALGGTNLFDKMVKTKLQNYGVKGLEVKNYYNSYFQECIVKGAMAYSEETASYIQQSTDLIKSLSPAELKNALNIDISNDYIDFYTGEKLTCQGAYDRLSTAYSEFKNSKEIEEYYKKALQGKIADPIAALGAVTSVYGQSADSDSSTKVQDFSLSVGLISQSNMAFANVMNGGKASAAEMYGAFGSGLSTASLIQSGKAKANYSAEQLPKYMAVLSFVMYVLFPLAFVVTIASGQVKILKNFFMAMLWIQLWPATFEVLAYFVNKDMIYEATSSIIDAGAIAHTTTNMINMDNMYDLFGTIASESAQASNLLWSAPVISGFILSGSWFSIMGMASSVGSHMSAGSNNDSIMKNQADLANEARLAKLSGGAWSPTAGEMGRMNIDTSLASSSGKSLGEIEALGLGGISGVAQSKASYGAIKDLSEYSHYDSSTAAASGLNAASQTDIGNTTLQKTMEEAGGYRGLVNRMSDAKTWDNFNSMSTSNSQRAAFNELYSEYREGRSQEDFYDYMNTQQGRADMAKSYGESTVVETLSDNKMISLSSTSKKDSIIDQENTKELMNYLGDVDYKDAKLGNDMNSLQTGTAFNISSDKNGLGEMLEQKVTALDKSVGDAQGFRSMAEEHFNGKTTLASSILSEYKYNAEHGIYDANDSIANKYFDDDVSAMKNSMSRAGVTMADHTGNTVKVSFGDDYKKGNKTTNRGVSDVTDNSIVTHNDRISTSKIEHDNSISVDNGIKINKYEDSAANRQIRDYIKDGDIDAANNKLTEYGVKDVLSKLTSKKGLIEVGSSLAISTDTQLRQDGTYGSVSNFAQNTYSSAIDSMKKFSGAYMQNTEWMVSEHGLSDGRNSPGSSQFNKSPNFNADVQTAIYQAGKKIASDYSPNR